VRARRFSGVLPLFFLFCSFSPVVLSAPVVVNVEWRDLSDRDISRDGREALQIHREAWQHAETEHFICHFRDHKQAETVFVHAETYYQWVKDMLGITEDPSKKKCHVFIFEDKVMWQEFNRQRPNERLESAEAYTNGTELFIYREPFYLSPQKALAHEITHIIVNRFMGGSLPLFLNEGLAETISYKAISLQAEGDDFAYRTVKMIPESDYISVEKLAAFKNYPASEPVLEVFYRESELLVRYLTLNFGKSKLGELLAKTAKGEAFYDCLNSIYGMDLGTFERKFRTYGVVSSQQ
jgi:hypothetical protein